MSAILPQVPPLAWAVQWQHRWQTSHNGRLDFSRLWWTPPLSARQAWDLDTQRVEKELGLGAIVSITDHDNVEAPLALRVLEVAGRTPISLEWTVPFEGTYFHLGVHNLPIREAHSLFATMKAYTAAPSLSGLAAILDLLNSHREVLIVLNHPLWDEKGIGKDRHRQRLEQLIRNYGTMIHAVEWNGFRPRRENADALALSQAFQLPLVAGDDRHGRQPSSVMNLSAAACLEEFIDDVRKRREISILRMPEQQEQRRLRVMEALCEILRDDPGHSLGWKRWSDRVFYRNDAGQTVPLSAIWRKKSVPAIIRCFVGLMALVDAGLDHSQLRSAMRMALAQGEEMA